jgi:DNA-binding CsgD family transcriptional regulator
MNGTDLSEADFWRLAERVWTDKQLAVLRYKAAGFSERRTADILDIARGTVRDHLRGAEFNLRQELTGSARASRASSGERVSAGTSKRSGVVAW